MSSLQPLISAESRALIEERDALRRDLDGVSVVVPCYQQAEYLAECIASIAQQTVPPLEVIVVDDGTPDSSVSDALGPLVPGQVYIRYYRITNRALPNARNTGLMLARGGWFLPLDADDWIQPDYLEKTLARAAETGADVVVTGLQEHGPRNGLYMPGWDRELEQVNEGLLWQSNRLFYCSLFRTELLRSVGGWNGRMIHGWEDWDLWIDLYRRGVNVAEVREPLFNYRTKHQSMLHDAEQHRDWNREEMSRHHQA